jgi:formylglycine-generating enzyme required for sulfatase activity
MRQIGIILLGVALAASLAQANTPPEVTNVVAMQRPHTGLIDVTFDLTDADGDDQHVTLMYSLDGGRSWGHECTTVSGDVGPGIQPATGLQVTWDAGTDVPDFQDQQFTLRVYADDGSGGIPAGFVRVEAGVFAMGSPPDEPGCWSDEVQHTVTLTTPFLIQVTAVTNQQYRDLAQWAYDNGYCTATTSSLRDALDGSTQELLDLDGVCEISFSGGVFTVDAGKQNHPVLEVTWYGAMAYCDWLSLQQGLPRAYDHRTEQCNGHAPYSAAGYRLPTEAEWEYACRAGSTTAFANGPITNTACDDPVLDQIGWYCGNAAGWTHPVGGLITNAWGLDDMHGNLAEWCNDWYGTYSGDETDPVGPRLSQFRVFRGGCWHDAARFCRSAYRRSSDPIVSYYNVGFRPVRSTF